MVEVGQFRWLGNSLVQVQAPGEGEPSRVPVRAIGSGKSWRALECRLGCLRVVEASDVLAILRIVLAYWSPRWNVEADLQVSLQRALQERGLLADREAWISDADRPDFMVGPIAIEVKVKGGRIAAHRQVARYLALDGVEGALFVTTKMQYAIDGTFNGKPVRTLLIRSGLP